MNLKTEVPADRRIVGGGDIAAILGLAPYSSPADVVLRIKHGVTKDVAEVADHGLAMEPGVFTLIEQAVPGKYERHPVLKHPKFKHGGGHLDLLRTEPDKAVVDAKMVHWRVRHRWEEDGQPVVPDYVRLQVDWYMQCAEAERGQIGAFFGLGDFRMFEVEPFSADVRGQILQAVEKFWVDHIEGDVPLRPDGSDGFLRWATIGYKDSEEVVEANGQIIELARQLLENRSAAKKLDEEDKLLKQEIVLAMKSLGATRAVGAGLKILWTQTGDTTIDWKGIVEELKPSPELIALKTKTKKPTPIIRVTEVKK